MAIEKESKKEGGDGLKNIIVFAVIWIALLSAIFANSNVRKFFSSFFTSSKISSYGDIIIVSPSKDVFSSAAFHFNKKVNVYDVVQSLTDPDYFYAATDSGLFISYDKGFNWYHLNLPKEIGDTAPIYRVFTNSRFPSQISVLIFKDDNGAIYATNDNFYSIIKSFEISKETAQKLVKDRTVSVILPAGDKFIVGTTK